MSQWRWPTAWPHVAAKAGSSGHECASLVPGCLPHQHLDVILRRWMQNCVNLFEQSKITNIFFKIILSLKVIWEGYWALKDIRATVGCGPSEHFLLDKPTLIPLQCGGKKNKEKNLILRIFKKKFWLLFFDGENGNLYLHFLAFFHLPPASLQLVT